MECVACVSENGLGAKGRAHRLPSYMFIAPMLLGRGEQCLSETHPPIGEINGVQNKNVYCFRRG